MGATLLDDLLERIRVGGPLPFEAYMRLALYHPEHGYYTSRVPGDGGDYGTSPSVSPWFGRLVARELAAMWQALGRPARFTVIEAGAGRADLAAAALDAAGPMAGALRWHFIEQFDAVADRQRERLGPHAAAARWGRGFPHVEAGCVLMHEVFDNFPVHQFEVGPDGSPLEVYVDAEAGRLVQRLGPPSHPVPAGHARTAAAEAALAPGRRLEVCPGLESWCRDASAAVAAGYLLVVDYGDREPDLWRNHPAGTLVTYGPDGFGEDPLRDPGRQDVTAEVNFSALTRAAEAAGWQPQLLTTQREWLRSLGLDGVVADLEAGTDQAWAEGRSDDALLLQGEVSRLLTLVARLGFGDIMVFRAAKGAAKGAPAL